MANAFANSFDLVIVDAPCSGQSLIARGLDNPGCFHPVNLKKNAMRQRRIVAEASKTLIPGGRMIYSTCTFAPEENEETISWLMKTMPQLEPIPVAALDAHRSTLSDFPCYRLHPHEGLGAGGFVAVLQSKAGQC
jgi:16S rRNA C967 or C1407 C5-methylase (RsmB/RsmF family)